MAHVLRYRPAVVCIGVITFMFWLVADYQPQPIEIGRVMSVIAGPILLILAGWCVASMGRASYSRFKRGERSVGRLLALAAALASGALILLGLVVVHMIDLNLGGYHQRGLFDVNLGCVIRLAFTIGVLLMFVFAGQGVVRVAQLSREKFHQGLFLRGAILSAFALLACAATVGLGWVLAICLLFTLFYRQ
jgi:hypothetical protein